MKVEDMIKTKGVELNNQKCGLNSPRVGCFFSQIGAFTVTATCGALRPILGPERVDFGETVV